MAFFVGTGGTFRRSEGAKIVSVTARPKRSVKANSAIAIVSRLNQFDLVEISAGTDRVSAILDVAVPGEGHAELEVAAVRLQPIDLAAAVAGVDELPIAVVRPPQRDIA